MRLLVRRRPRYAEVTAALAVIVTMGGTSYAVSAIPRNSVGTAQLKAHAVTKSKLAVGLATVGQPGPPGAVGPPGSLGASGAAGVPGISGYEIVVGAPTFWQQYALALCPGAKRALGGGVTTDDSATFIFRSRPTFSPNTVNSNGWVAQSGVHGRSTDATAYAICATVS